jgi:hypothetical protein
LIKALLGLALLVIACTPKPPIERAPRLATPHEAAATVVLLSANRDRHPCCSAVAVLDAQGLVMLDTAAHCVVHKINQDDPAPDADQWANIGDSIWYRTQDGYYPQRATIAKYDAVRDRATLEPVDGDAPPPLALRRAKSGSRVHAVSGLYGYEVHDGRVQGKTFAGAPGVWFWESDVSIVPGWSGSPVLNEAGEVVGIISKCNGVSVNAGDRILHSCLPGWSIFTDAL